MSKYIINTDKYLEHSHIFCNQCDTHTIHKVLFSTCTDNSYEGEAYFINSQLIHCNGCGWQHFRTLEQGSAYLDYDRDGVPYHKASETLYPQKPKDIRVEREDIFPQFNFDLTVISYQPIQQVYKETIKAFNNNLYILAGLGVRTCLERFANEHNATGGNLEDKIESLLSLGLIAVKDRQTLHGIRFLGNSSAHSIDETPKRAQVEDALFILENLFYSTYILSKKKIHKKQDTIK